MEAQNSVIGMSRKWKLIFSGVIWYCTFALGLGVGFIGPSLIQLSKKFETGVPTVSKVFSVITFSFLVGAAVWGVLFNHVNRQIASGLLLVVMGLATLIMPNVPTLLWFFIFAAIVGVSAAGYDTAQIVWIIEMWGAEAPPYIQTQHFSFAVGALASPLLMKSFLPAESRPSNAVRTAAVSPNVTLTELGTSGLSTLFYNSTPPQDPEAPPSQFHVPFMIGGIVAMVGGVAVLLLYCIKKYEKPRGRDETKENGGEVQIAGKSKGCNLRKVVLVLLSALVLGAYSGMEQCSLQFIPAFTHFIDLKLSEADGALVLSALAAAFTVGRGAGIFVVLKIRPEILLLGNFVLVLTGNTLLYFFANTSPAALWAGAVTLGMGFSTVFPSYYGFIERHLKVSNAVGAAMIVACGMVSGLYPILIGSFIERNPLILMYTNYFSLVLATVAFLTIFAVTRGGVRGHDQYDMNEVKRDVIN